jgi:ubiquinone/menaquinone biosynthesis C-methylase UbiE
MFAKTAAFYDAVYGFKDYAKEADLVHQAIGQAKRSPGNALLDVACGTGVHLSHFRNHYEVEGLDLEEGLLTVARHRNPDVVFYQGDMTHFDLSHRFDAITCLFSSIGYVVTVERLQQTLENFARHLNPGGVAVVEPWLLPDVFHDGHLSALFIDQPDLKLARMCRSEKHGNVSVFPFEYLITTPEGTEHLAERHEMGLFTVEQYLAAFQVAGFEVQHDPQGPTGRGLFIGVKP